MKLNFKLMIYHLFVLVLSITYPIALYLSNNIEIFSNFRFQILPLILRYLIYIIIGSCLSAFAYYSKKMFSFLSIKIHVFVWIIVYMFLMLITPIAFLQIFTGPNILIDILFISKFNYLNELPLILVGFYMVLLIISLKNRIDSHDKSN